MGNLHRLVSPENLRRLAWLALLGPLFFASYNLANQLSALREPGVPAIVFSWEKHIPFLAWTIVPYWSSDVLYAVSFLRCRTKAQIDRHGSRLLAVQVVSVLLFVVFPLRLTSVRPALDGYFATLFDVLGSFDLPYNQAPSLHVSLAYILWRQFGGWGWGAVFTLIGLSTLTTYQHHFIDLPTGLWAGVLVVALLPERSRPECTRPRLAALYFAAAVALTVTAFSLCWWILLWPAFSLSIVMAAYWTGNVELLGKRGSTVPPWMWPYNALAWLNSRLWNSKTSEVAGGVWVGRPDLAGFSSVIDLTGELPLRADCHVPMLDLALPSCEQISAAVEAVRAHADRRPTLICCALGYSRSAAVAAAWLVDSGRAESMEQAVAMVRSARPKVVMHPDLVARLTEWAGGHDASRD